MRVLLTFAGPGPDARFELLVGAVRVLGRAVAKKAVAKTGGKMPFFYNPDVSMVEHYQQ